VASLFTLHCSPHAKRNSMPTNRRVPERPEKRTHRRRGKKDKIKAAPVFREAALIV